MTSPKYQRRWSAVFGAILLFSGWLSVSACIDPVDLDLGPFERRLVVEGLLTEGPGPHTVRLSWTGAFTQGLEVIREREEGAVVIIRRGDGGEVVLTERGQGLYETDIEELVGEVGQTYILEVLLSDGLHFQSTEELMHPSEPIDSVYADLEEGRRIVNGILLDDPRFVVFADAQLVPGQASYFRWSWSGTYAVQACYDIFSANPQCDLCFRDTRGGSVIEVGRDETGSGGVLPRQRVDDFRLTELGHRFHLGHQIRVERQALSPQAFVYWDRVRQTRDEVGSLFDVPAEPIIGNITRVDHPDDYALGYFTVAGTTHREFCLRRSDIPEAPNVGSSFLQGQCGVTVTGSIDPPPEHLEICGDVSNGP